MGPWARCDRCDFRVRHAECRTEWSGLFVCTKCWDPRPPYLDPPRINPHEGAPVRNARLDDENPTFVGDTDVTSESL